MLNSVAKHVCCNCFTASISIGGCEMTRSIKIAWFHSLLDWNKIAGTKILKMLRNMQSILVVTVLLVELSP
jgi:hypothetical protein